MIAIRWRIQKLTRGVLFIYGHNGVQIERMWRETSQLDFNFDEDFGGNIQQLLQGLEIDLDGVQDIPKQNDPKGEEIQEIIKKFKKKYPKRHLLSNVITILQRLAIVQEKQKESILQNMLKYKETIAERHYQERKQVIKNNRPQFVVTELGKKAINKSNKVNKVDETQTVQSKITISLKKKQEIHSQRDEGNKESKDNRLLIGDDNLKKSTNWSFQVQNKSHRLYCSKVVPKFNSRDEEYKYYEKRLAAKAFCERGNNLNHTKSSSLLANIFSQPISLNPVPQSLPNLGCRKPFKLRRCSYRQQQDRNASEIPPSALFKTLFGSLKYSSWRKLIDPSDPSQATNQSLLYPYSWRLIATFPKRSTIIFINL